MIENPLLESFQRLYKKAQKLSPESRKQFMRHYALSRFSNNGLDDAANEYAKRSFRGQLKRAKSLAKQHGRNLTFTQVPEETGMGVLGSATSAKGLHKLMDANMPMSKKTKRLAAQNSPKDILQLATPNDTIQPLVKNNIAQHPELVNMSLTSRKVEIPNKRAERKLRKFASTLNDDTSALTTANLTQHEIDEYDALLKLAKKHHMNPIDISTINTINRGNAPGSHLPGVLKKEYERSKQLSDMFGRDRIAFYPRSKAEYSANSKPFVIPRNYQENPIWKQMDQLKQMGYITV